MSRRPTLGGRRGNALVVGVSLTMLIGFASLAVDMGIVMLAKSQLRVAVDAAALAAAGVLDGTEAGLDDARSAALALASDHAILGAPVTLDAVEVEFGAWDEDGGFVADNDASDVDAVRILHTPPPVKMALAGVAFGVQTLQIDATSIARRPRGAGTARSSLCFLPLAVPDCLAEGSNPAPREFNFAPDPSANVAWARPGSAPTAAWIGAQIDDRCAGGTLRVGDLIELDQSEHLTALQSTRDLLNDLESVAPDPWLTSVAMPARDGVAANVTDYSEIWNPEWGNTIQGPVALVDAGDCSSPTMTGSLEITGITWGAIYDVYSLDCPEGDDDDASGDDGSEDDDDGSEEDDDDGSEEDGFGSFSLGGNRVFASYGGDDDDGSGGDDDDEEDDDDDDDDDDDGSEGGGGGGGGGDDGSEGGGGGGWGGGGDDDSEDDVSGDDHSEDDDSGDDHSGDDHDSGDDDDDSGAGCRRNIWLQLDAVTDYDTWSDIDPDADGNVLGMGPPRLEGAP